MAFRPNRTPLVEPGSIDHHVEDLSATFSAEVTLAAAQAKLREHGQWLPIDGGEDETLRALVERNSTGPLRLGFGAWRDLLLGVQFTNGADELITAGGRTLKNVAGYDLTKFMVGQYGIFGKVVTLTTRTYKAPEAAVLATFDRDAKKLNTLLLTPCRPQWAVLTKDALLCGYLGDRATADFYQANIPQHAARDFVRHTLDDDIAVRARLWRADAGAGFTFRASIPPSRLAEFITSISATDWRADAMFGIVLGSCAPDTRENLHNAADNVGGSVIIFDASGKPKDLRVDPTVAALLGRLKNSFDPEGKLESLPLAQS
jgi:FAD/FMN-containing dehydrogenase